MSLKPSRWLKFNPQITERENEGHCSFLHFRCKWGEKMHSFKQVRWLPSSLIARWSLRQTPRHRYVPSVLDRLRLITASASLDRHCSFFIHPHSSWCYYNSPPSLHASCLLCVHESFLWSHTNTQTSTNLQARTTGTVPFPYCLSQQPPSYALLSSTSLLQLRILPPSNSEQRIIMELELVSSII